MSQSHLNTYLQNFLSIKNEILTQNNKITIVVVTKSVEFDDIKYILEYGHLDFGENRVQNSVTKWEKIKNIYPNIKLHFIGKAQSNKAEEIVSFFSYVHSLDNKNLAQQFLKAEKKLNKNIKYFIQINTGSELQKSGISIAESSEFIRYCVNELKLNIIGLMCLPPIKDNPVTHFSLLRDIAKKNNLQHLSMGMSNDYLEAISNNSTFVRIGSKIFN
jgi:pyridoxal phosphate enzyme (YggS family)